MIQHVRQDSGMDWYEEKAGNDDFHVCLVTYGKCVYWINRTKVVAAKGDAILIREGVPFYGKSIPTVFHSKYATSFRLTADFPKLPMLSSAEYIHTKLGCYDLIYERMKEIAKQWTEKPSYYEIYDSAVLIEILTHWNRELDQGVISSDKHRSVELMKKYMQDHYREKITKNDLACVLRKSPNYTATLFRTVTGQTISEYVHRLRIKTAVYMLLESQLNVSEISEYLGYSDVSYFNKIFKQLTEKSPSDYMSQRPSRMI